MRYQEKIALIYSIIFLILLCVSGIYKKVYLLHGELCREVLGI